MRNSIQILIIVCGVLGIMSQAQATYIERTITMDGVMTDWYDTDANTYDPAGDITNNTGQFSEDLEDGDGDLDEPINSVGRDLKKFSFTWDDDYLYFYVERFASSNNVTDWWFYIDSTTGGVAGTGPDGLLQSGETVLRVRWQGNNQNTEATLYEYVADASGGDPLTNAGVGDGYTMPGDVTNDSALYNENYGSSTGLEMETIMDWSDILGISSPENIAFHISSSNGSNLPNNILDNMDGPAGGQLFPVNLEVSKSASVTSIRGLQNFTYTIEVFNGSIDPFTDVDITDNLPSQVTYVSHVASSGTYSSGVWDISSIASNATETLTITVRANALPVQMNVGNTATLTASTPADEDATDDASTATVTIIPIPELTVVKYITGTPTNSDPDTEIEYNLVITNAGGDDGELIEITDQLSPYEKLKIDYDGATGHPFDFVPGASGLTLGARTYSANYGVDLYGHTLATDPPDTYDEAVTNFRIIMTGTMNHTGASFTIRYRTRIK